jgi:predicted permease
MVSWIESYGRDVVYALRQLRKSPGFALIAVVMLALGIGANTAVFSVMNAVLLASLPVSNPQELVYLHTSNFPGGQTGYGDTSMRMQVFEALRKEDRVFSDLMAWVPLSFSNQVPARFGKDPEQVKADMVSGNFFTGLGVRPLRGRVFNMDDERNHTQFAVLSYDYWTRRFDRNAGVLGQPLYIKGVPFIIVGVTAEQFTGLDRGSSTDVWVPFQISDDIKPWGSSASSKRDQLYGQAWWFLLTVGRLRPGVNQQQAVAYLNPIFQQAAYLENSERPENSKPPQLTFTDTRGMEGLRDAYEKPLRILMGLVALVLVIACGNVAMLLVARNTARVREFSVRQALGETRVRLFRQLLADAALLVGGGTLLGWLFAVWATKALAQWSLVDRELTPDRTVLIFTIAVSVLASLVFSFAPLRSVTRFPIWLALRTSSATTHHDYLRQRSGQAVLALQMSLCLVLLIAAGLLLGTLRNLEHINAGMRVDGLLVFGLNPQQHAPTDAQAKPFFQSALERMRRIPGVESATLLRHRVGGGWSSNTSVLVDGQKPKTPDGGFAGVRWNMVGPDFLRTLGIPVVAGRDFNDSDTSASAPAIIVNQTFVKKYLGDSTALGHQVTIGHVGSMAMTIIGVAGDSKFVAMREDPRPMAYIPFAQWTGIDTLNLELRTAGNPEAFWPQVRRAVAEFAPDLPLLNPATQRQQLEDNLSQERMFARLSAFFGGLAVLLVATGLYGSLAYRVARRTSEIGIRMALGAQRLQVLWMVLRESLVLCLFGALIGLPVALAAARLMRSMLFGLRPSDPLALVASLAGIAIVAMAGSFIPARRAANVDPIVALRTE